MAGWHHWLDGLESKWTPGVGDEQGGLACCDSRGRKESDTTERLNWTEYSTVYMYHNFSGNSDGLYFIWLWEFVMDRGTWCAAIHWVTKSGTRLSDWTEINWTVGYVMAHIFNKSISMLVYITFILYVTLYKLNPDYFFL